MEKYICSNAKECNRKIVWCNKPFPLSAKKDFDEIFKGKCPWDHIKVSAIPYYRGKEISYASAIKCPYGTGKNDGKLGACHVNSYMCHNECQYFQGIDDNRKVIWCSFEDHKEDKMEYEVIKEFTKYDYILAHQKKYKWSEHAKSCKEFQEDMKLWTGCNIFASKGTEFDKFFHIKYSDNFYTHAIEFGFIKEKKEEVFYKVGDRFNVGHMDNNTYILCRVDINTVNLFSLLNGNRWSDPLEVKDTLKIPADMLNEWAGIKIKKL
jgi:hypothetical protein